MADDLAHEDRAVWSFHRSSGHVDTGTLVNALYLKDSKPLPTG
jgi:hypothetical protein